MHGRSEDKLRKAMDYVKRMSGSERIRGYLADFESLEQVKAMGERIRAENPKIDILINNAGVFNPKNRLTHDAYETTWQVNVIVPYLLTNILLPCVQQAKDGRVIMVSSISQCSRLDFDNLQQEKGYSAHDAYSTSKLADAMLCYELSSRIKDTGITVNTLDPGTVNTKMLKEGWGDFGIDIDAANDQFWLATDPKLAGISGKYFVSRSERKSSSFAYDEANLKRLLEELESQCNAVLSNVKKN
eukprot:CAMPEP_0114491812 /NCGR_PEP_ID=MMETSP0109-20121206/3211_1 /TAXON_ID=29199 /ORGANISM="Chlorarachnion reptans, Strain CCCM449" /LENGTH=243 /DNA_ID=CAMNT_0001668593 /DNA_START=127 /DNA_END=858 /DNA_ORIENTATION=-